MSKVDLDKLRAWTRCQPLLQAAPGVATDITAAADELALARAVVEAADKIKFDGVSHWAKLSMGFENIDELNAALAAYRAHVGGTGG